MAGMADTRCAPKSGRVRERNPFPVFPGEPEIQGPMKRSRMGRRRGLVLGAVYVAMAVHLLHWKLTGSTLSPVEPSESMRTLELGDLNAGALFFAASILATLVFGRFVCGWGCHIVALQDLCNSLLRRAGIRPRPFRARLLAWVPVGLALYMFVWPTAKRVLLVPWARAFLPARGFFAAPPPFPGFSDHLQTEHFWATFAGVGVAIPFLLVCGFAVVYLLGAKGFCTYGCPYGAFFGAADLAAPGRIRVNDDCNGCGHCTAVCTSNVRVHDEVRRHGMVVDPGCMKCLDCVSTCPREALRWSFGALRPTGAVPSARHYDLAWRGELAVFGFFAFSFLAWRGVYGLVPMLMAVGIALCVTALAWTTWRMLTAPDVALQNLTLRRSGAWTGTGRGVSALAALALLLTAQSVGVRVLRNRAEAADAAVHASREAVFAGTVDEASARAAGRAASLYRRADGMSQGGIGLVAPKDIAMRRAWLALVLGDADTALRHLERVAGPESPDAAVRMELARVRQLAGHPDAARRDIEAAVAARPDDPEAHRIFAGILEASGDRAGAARELVIVVNLDPTDGASRGRLTGLLESLGRGDEARRYR